MNDFLQKVMTFINENTYILIGICVFLILVLIGYLIDNSVKSKKMRDDINNKNQAIDDIKPDIIEKANKNKTSIETINNVNRKLNLDNSILNDNKTLNSEVQIDQKEQETLFDDAKLNQDSNLNMLKEESINDISSFDIGLNTDNSLDVDIDINKLNDEFDNKIKETDSDLDKISSEVAEKKLYNNDKKLSEILAEAYKEEKIITNDSTNIFDNNSLDIKVNNNIEKNKVDIETKDDDELEKIMKKLSSMSNEDDSYTNIF